MCHPQIAQKDFGKQIGTKLTQRVNELAAARHLYDVSLIPSARLHPLKGQHNQEYAIDLVHPFRLVIRAIFDGKQNMIDLKEITIVRIEEVIDYHGKQKRK